MKLSPAQEIAYKKLSPRLWLTPYALQTSRATLDALVNKGLAEKRGAGKLGAMAFPRTVIEYRRKSGES
jgi:hypothetical protein